MEQHFVFLDLETGGLDGRLDDGRMGCVVYPIIELALHITDLDLNVIDGAGLRIVVHQSDEVLASMSEWAIEQHTKSGLLDEVRRSSVSLRDAESMCLEYMAQHRVSAYNFKEKTGAVMAGNNIRFDRNFINAQMPTLDKYFHYRMIDFSALNLLCRSWQPEVNALINKKYNHLALDDIRETIAEAKVYKKALF